MQESSRISLIPDLDDTLRLGLIHTPLPRDSAGNTLVGVNRNSKLRMLPEMIGIEDFRFHDLRHTFASHMIMRGASLKEVQEILGHKNIAITMRYAHLSQEHKKRAVNLLSGLTASKKLANDATSQNVTSLKPSDSTAG